AEMNALARVRCVAFDYGGTLDDQRQGAACDLMGSYPLHPDARAALEKLAAAGLGLLVASGTRPGQSRNLALRSVAGMFLTVLETDKLGYGKNDMRFWDRVVAASQQEPDQILYAGNRVGTDVVPALRHGLQAALVVGEADTPRGTPDNAVLI